jgi:hypothetical protein
MLSCIMLNDRLAFVYLVSRSARRPTVKCHVHLCILKLTRETFATATVGDGNPPPAPLLIAPPTASHAIHPSVHVVVVVVSVFGPNATSSS